MKFLSGIIFVMGLVIVAGIIIVITQSKKINELEFQNKAQPKVVEKIIPGEPEEFITPIPPTYMPRDSLPILKKSWLKSVPPEIIKETKTDTLWLEKEEFEVAQLDTTFTDSGRLIVKYWLPPVSIFDVKWRPMIREKTITVTERMKQSPWGFAGSILTGKQGDNYHIGMTGTLFFRKIGITAYFDSEGLTMGGLSVLW